MPSSFRAALLAALAAVMLFSGVSVASARNAPAPAPAVAQPTTGAVFKPTFVGDFPPEALAAWDKVNDALLRHVTLTVDVEVTVTWNAIDGGYIGMGGSMGSRMDFPNAQFAGTWYPVSLANQIAGSRLADGPDIGVDMNSDVPWDYSGNPPAALKAGVNDYVTTLMHEILHGMGWSGTADFADGVGKLGDGDGIVPEDRKLAHLSVAEAARRGTPFLCVLAPGASTAPHTLSTDIGALSVWDHFIVDGAGNLLTNDAVYANPSPELGKALTGNDLYWNGSAGLTANGGKPVKIYAPPQWSGPSSYSHLDDATYDGGPDSILTSAGEKMPNIELGPRVIGILGDMGWPVH